MPTITLSRRAFFSAGRRLHAPHLSDEENRALFGRDALPHGHDYILDVFYGGTIDERDGMIVNLTDLKPVIATVLAPLDGAFLDADVPHFQRVRPTAENLVNFVWQQLPKELGEAHLVRITLRESASTRVEKNSQFMRITRSYEFAAAHRLHVPQMSEESNAALYGRCNNLAGHGHNYGLEVTVEGAPDEVSGRIIAPDELDKIVEEEVFDNFDHKHLNIDCPEFQSLVPTSENLARVIFDKMSARLDNETRHLAKIGLHETQKNYFEVEA
jgi:6-pyruvoyltetrahydropterin/6-carboxytetrahydropterin synthase